MAQYCRSCGAAIDPNSNFCTYCGASVENSSYSNGSGNNNNANYNNNNSNNNSGSGVLGTAATVGGVMLGASAINSLARSLTHRRRPPYMGPMGGPGMGGFGGMGGPGPGGFGGMGGPGGHGGPR